MAPRAGRGDDSDGSDDGPGPSRMPAIEALSQGRAKRSTAGNRMRELLEQERERLEGDGDKALSSRDARRPTVSAIAGSKGEAQGEHGDEDDIFGEEEGENDVDFEEIPALEGADDIIDSDFDQSSNDGNDEEAEDEGERRLIAEEKAAKKASRGKAKALPAHMRPRSAIHSGGEASTNDERPRKMKRIAFASADNDSDANSAAKRYSKRAATMQVTQTVQERVQQDEERRAKLRETAQPKRTKMRLSQADYIAEALEMEESNRESLKIYMEREEERRERERKRSKRRMEGPFLRWRSFAVDGNAVHQQVFVKQEDATQNLINPSISNSAAHLLEDPAIAARKAAVEERERQAEKANEKEAEDQVHHIAPELGPSEQGLGRNANDADMSMTATGPNPAVAAMAAMEGDTQDRVSRAVPISVAEDLAQPMTEAPTQQPGNTPAIEVTTASAMGELPPNAMIDQIAVSGDELKQDHAARNSTAHTSTRFPFISGTLQNQDGNVVKAEALKPEWEGRATVSLHNIPTATPWPIVFTQVLGSHADWSRYPVVAARNRPLRPRQSVCPITGLPARYRDPRSGIAYATREAYDVITQLLQGQYRWSCKPDELSREADAIKSRITNPLDLGCYMDRIDEPGACNVLLTASAMMPQAPQAVAGTEVAKPASNNSKPVRRPPSMVYASGVLVAPGDEQAVIAAASELPAGSTRSGTRRGARGT